MYGHMYGGPPPHTTSSIPGGAGSGNNNLMALMNERDALALLQHLDKNELEHLLNDDAKLQDLVSDLSQVRNLQQRHDNQVATNKSLAEYNLSLRPRLEDLKLEVATQYEKLNELKTSLAKGKAQLDGFVNNQKLDTVLALLQTETAKTEEESEELASKFCSDGNMDSFLDQFLKTRTLAHQRRIKTEQFGELIQQQGHLASSSSSAAAAASASSSSHMSYHNHQPPYPSNDAFGMSQFNMFPR